MGYRVASISKHKVGHGVVANLKKMGLTKNLYYEIKDVIVEERQDGVHSYKQKIRTKVYGLNNTQDIRRKLIDILIERVENHKDKIVSPIIYNELLGMEIKRNGKVEHSASTHDDQVFSMLMALYMWYEGVNMAERFGMKKCTIKTDEDIDEQIDYFNDETVDVVGSFNTEDTLSQEIEHDLTAAIKAGGQTMQEFLDKRHAEEEAKFQALINTPLGEKAYRNKYNIPADTPLTNYVGPGAGQYTVPDYVFSSFYNPAASTFEDRGEVPEQATAPGNQGYLLDDDEYKYTEHFNF